MPNQPFTPEQHAQIKAFIDDECPVYEIARTLGVSPKRIVREFPGSQRPATERGDIGQMFRMFNSIPFRLTETKAPLGKWTLDAAQTDKSRWPKQ